jgi:hypothetical protein
MSNAVTVFMITERCGMILTGACAQLSKAVMPEHSLQDMDVFGILRKNAVVLNGKNLQSYYELDIQAI